MNIFGKTDLLKVSGHLFISNLFIFTTYAIL